MRFLLDNDLPFSLAAGLAPILRHSHAHEIDHARRVYRDVGWSAMLSRLALDDWVLVKGNGNIRNVPLRMEAIRNSGAKVVFFSPAFERLPVQQQAGFLLLRWDTIGNALKVCPYCLFEAKGGKPLAPSGGRVRPANVPGFRSPSVGAGIPITPHSA